MVRHFNHNSLSEKLSNVLTACETARIHKVIDHVLDAAYRAVTPHAQTAVDALLDKVVSATSRPELVTSLRALDRVLRHGHYVVPHWYGAVHRVSWRAKAFARPADLPRFYQPEKLVTTVWWSPNGSTSVAAPKSPKAP